MSTYNGRPLDRKELGKECLLFIIDSETNFEVSIDHWGRPKEDWVEGDVTENEIDEGIRLYEEYYEDF